MMDYEKAIESTRSQIRGWRTTAFVGVAVGLVLFVVVLVQMRPDGLDLNELGDALAGIVGVWWSLAALILVYVAFLGQKEQLLHQQEELRLSRKELEATRAEIAGQREQLEKQNEHLRQQSNEATFFRMLDLYSNVVGSLDTGNRSQHSGRDCFVHWHSHLSGGYNKSRATDHEAKLAEAITGTYRAHESDLGPYFRAVQSVLEILDHGHVRPLERFESVFAGQLSAYELVLVFYFGVSDHAHPKLKGMCERHGLFRHLERRYLFNGDDPERYVKTAHRGDE